MRLTILLGFLCASIFLVKSVESFFVVNENEIKRLLEFIDLLQHNAERDNTVHRDFLARNPACCRRRATSIFPCIRSRINLHRTLRTMHSSMMSRQLSHTVKSPFLVTSTKAPCIQSARDGLMSQILQNSWCSILTDSTGSALSISSDMRSTPGTLLDFKLWIAVSMSCIEGASELTRDVAGWPSKLEDAVRNAQTSVSIGQWSR